MRKKEIVQFSPVSGGAARETASANALSCKHTERTGPPVTTAEVAVEPYIDKREVGRRLGRTTRTVDNMMRRGLVPYYKWGFRVVFRWSEIQTHMAETCRVCRREG